MVFPRRRMLLLALVSGWPLFQIAPTAAFKSNAGRICDKATVTEGLSR